MIKAYYNKNNKIVWTYQVIGSGPAPYTDEQIIEKFIIPAKGGNKIDYQATEFINTDDWNRAKERKIINGKLQIIPKNDKEIEQEKINTEKMRQYKSLIMRKMREMAEKELRGG